MRKSIDIGGKADIALKHANGIDRGKDLFPTGSTLLNLALSDDPYGGFAAGCLANIIGDQSSGKTFLSWSIFAEMNADDAFKDYVLYYDDVEQRLRIAVEKMFGKKISERVVIEGSDLIEDYYSSILQKFKKKRSFVHVLDCLDALSDREEKKREELKKDYPAKTNLLTEMLRKIKAELRQTSSFLVIVSQTRENIGVVFGPKKRRAGGRALGHYDTYEMWLSQRGEIAKKGREVGVHVNVKITKNSMTGKLREVKFDILHDYGIDDVSSMVDWMCDEGFWLKEKGKQTIDTGKDFGVYTRDKLISMIDKEKREGELIGIVAACWKQLEDEVRTNRRPRYS